MFNLSMLQGSENLKAAKVAIEVTKMVITQSDEVIAKTIIALTKVNGVDLVKTGINLYIIDKLINHLMDSDYSIFEICFGIHLAKKIKEEYDKITDDEITAMVNKGEATVKSLGGIFNL